MDVLVDVKQKICLIVLIFDLLNDCWIQEIYIIFGCLDGFLVEYVIY